MMNIPWAKCPSALSAMAAKHGRYARHSNCAQLFVHCVTWGVALENDNMGVRHFFGTNALDAGNPHVFHSEQSSTLAHHAAMATLFRGARIMLDKAESAVADRHKDGVAWLGDIMGLQTIDHTLAIILLKAYPQNIADRAPAEIYEYKFRVLSENLGLRTIGYIIKTTRPPGVPPLALPAPRGLDRV
jgi:hypothetical protein